MLNHSCIRCRTKKLRCDGHTPCTNCNDKGLADSCERAIRKERPRRADTKRTRLDDRDDSDTSHAYQGSASGMASSPKRKSSASSVAQSGGGSSLPTLSSISADNAASMALQAHPEASSAPHKRGSFDSSHYPQRGSDRLPKDNFEMAPARLRGCLVTMQQIHQARKALGNPRSCGRLLSFVFHYRCQSMAHSAIHLPTLKRTFRQVFNDEWAPELTQDQLSLVLIAIAVSIQFTPRAGPYGYLYKLVSEGLGPEYGPKERQVLLHDLARNIAHSRLVSNTTTLEGLQAIVLFLMYDLDEESWKDQLFRHAIRGAQRVGMDHIQPERGNTRANSAVVQAASPVEREMMVRLWWYFVSRDWLLSLSRSSFSLDPSTFTTRLPTIITDEELTEGAAPESESAVWSPVSVSLPFISLASLIRQMVGLRHQKTKDTASERDYCDRVAEAFDQWAEDLPPLFSLAASFRESEFESENSVRAVQRLETERWILHHQMFHAYLQLHEYRLDQPVPPVMVSLASHILNIQDKIRLRCHIIDSLRINVTGVLRASTVLCIDLMQKHRTPQISLFRQMQIGKLREAINKTREATRLMDGDLEKVERLLEMEDTAWKNKTKASIARSNAAAIEGSRIMASDPSMSPHRSSASPSSASASYDCGPRHSDSGFSSVETGKTSMTSGQGSVSLSSPHSYAPKMARESFLGSQGLSQSNRPKSSSQQHCSSSGFYEQTKSGQMYTPPLHPQQQPQHHPHASNQNQQPFGMASLQSQQGSWPTVPQASAIETKNMETRLPQQSPSALGQQGPTSGSQPYLHTQQPHHSSQHGQSLANPSPNPPAPFTDAATTTGGPANSYLAQWIDLLPTDQAVSPIFGSEALNNIHEPSWEELYTTFLMQQQQQQQQSANQQQQHFQHHHQHQHQQHQQRQQYPGVGTVGGMHRPAEPMHHHFQSHNHGQPADRMGGLVVAATAAAQSTV